MKIKNNPKKFIHFFRKIQFNKLFDNNENLQFTTKFLELSGIYWLN